jgi:predicted transcriptional regulator
MINFNLWQTNLILNMSSGEEIDRFYDMLFEMSNDIRHNILLLLIQKPERMTQIAKVLDLTSPEVSRHLTRLSETRLIEKDSVNFYHVTNFGEYLLNSLVDLEFITKHREYFVKHSAVNIPQRFQKRMSEISKYRLKNNFMEFLSFINEKIKESQEYVWLYIDQYPILALDSMHKSVERGVKYRIIEQIDLSENNIFDKKHLIPKGEDPPLVEVKVHERKDIYLFISDQGSAISFPTREGFDYTGFVTDDNDSIWVKDLFEYYWSPAKRTMTRCILCSETIRSDPIIEVIDGKEEFFDTVECVLTFKRLKQIYGERFR